jgi:hypothetical protein
MEGGEKGVISRIEVGFPSIGDSPGVSGYLSQLLGNGMQQGACYSAD